MIPKVIHYCWLSNDPYPDKIRACMDTWKRVLPDYEFINWNFDRFPRGKSKWVDQAFDCRKYAFAADYIRAYVLYNYGGIYLDTDVAVVKPYDDLLDLPYFFGREMPESPIEAATMGCEKGNPLIKDILDYYGDRGFINDDGAMNNEPMPSVFRRLIAAKYKMRDIKSIAEFDRDPSVINIFPLDWFSPKEWGSGKIRKTDETYSVHQFYASWFNRRQRFALWVSRNISSKLGWWVNYFTRDTKDILKSLTAALKRRCGLNKKEE